MGIYLVHEDIRCYQDHCSCACYIMDYLKNFSKVIKGHSGRKEDKVMVIVVLEFERIKENIDDREIGVLVHFTGILLCSDQSKVVYYVDLM